MTTGPQAAASNAAWIDGDPLMEPIAAAVWAHCDTENSIVTDDPRTIAAIAAAVARAMQPALVDRAAVRAEALDEQGPDDLETISEAAQMYRSLRPVIERTMADPDRWDGDEDEAFHLGRSVEWLAAERSPVRAEELHAAADAVEAMNESCGQSKPCASCDAREDVAAELRRRADEAQPTTEPEASAAIRRKLGKWACAAGHIESELDGAVPRSDLVEPLMNSTDPRAVQFAESRYRNGYGPTVAESWDELRPTTRQLLVSEAES
ncbi:hypothetical protein [Streptomyces aureocirculatus]|uniref:hypothetical protein n=1 Tax=Streptomyces aureocirculatus TaxID=67275 RepID=UPI0004CA296E|nr:hypothetical protein [Streptomyces aureocirculatus]